ncbi:MAG: tRNA lysidine(34) synthetase TilS [Bryobacterales bacterium]|nr:tRNA lysidine(34) synthetase TilS [Bryobacterales bacterium]
MSGGADSVCLLHILLRLGWPVHVLHVNHGLRGAESEGDERFVAKMAASLGAPFESCAGGLGAGNLEAAARARRLEYFQAARERLGLGAVATGHTRTDQAETVLFRAMRGSGPGGLAGVLPVTREGLVRPLLGVSRGEVRAWLAAEGLAWREDSSNGESRFARNRIRGEVLPLLESILPQATESLARLAGIAGEEEEYWRGEVERLWQPVEERPGVVILEAGVVAGLAPVVGRRVIRYAMERALGGCGSVTLEQVERVMALARRPEGRGKVMVAGGEVWRSFGWLRIGRAVEAPPVRVLVEESAYNEGRHRIDAGKAPMPWRYRAWQPGDCYQPVGADRPMKLKELFHRARVPSWDRRDWPMVLCEDRIVWSRRFGVAQWAMAGPRSRHIVDVREQGE